jgi:hypothetical protein
MKPGERGGYGRPNPGGRKGPISQDQLVKLLPPLIDAAMAKTGSRTRDDARKSLREVLSVAHWRTSYVLHNLKQRRCRYLSSLGYPIETKWMTTKAENIASLEASKTRRS